MKICWKSKVMRVSKIVSSSNARQQRLYGWEKLFSLLHSALAGSSASFHSHFTWKKKFVWIHYVYILNSRHWASVKRIFLMLYSPCAFATTALSVHSLLCESNLAHVQLRNAEMLSYTHRVIPLSVVKSQEKLCVHALQLEYAHFMVRAHAFILILGAWALQHTYTHLLTPADRRLKLMRHNF